MKHHFTLLFYLLTTLAISAQEKTVTPFPLNDVRLTESPFLTAQKLDICYLLSLDADRLMSPYRRAAGLQEKAPSYPNWENTGLDGHVGGHYLAALAQMYAATSDARIKERMEYVISEMKECATAAKGYVGGIPNGIGFWESISRGEINANAFGLNNRWVPLYNIHKTLAGLRDAYVYAHNDDARKLLIGLTDYILKSTEKLTDEQVQQMLVSEHGGLNEVFADVADITKDKTYMTLAQRFCHKRLLEPLENGEDKLTGMHANTQIPKVIGFKRIADLTNNAQMDKAAQFFWQTVTTKRSISIGGNSVFEHFHASDDFTPMLESEQGPETCNTYNMLRLSRLLYSTSVDTKYVDYYERALYNHILSTINPLQGGFVYFTPMRAGHYRVYSQPQTSFWCCVGSGLENHARYGEMIYAHSADNVYVNLFIASKLNWSERNITISQVNNFPYDEQTSIKIDNAGNGKFSLYIRQPEWCNEATFSINNETVKPSISNGYAVIDRKWKAGDVVTVKMPMHLTADQLPDGKQYYALRYGPMVLAANVGTENQTNRYADDGRGAHIAAGPKIPADKMPVFIGDKDFLKSFAKAQNDICFTSNSIAPNEFQTLKFEPFYRLHDCRYVVYLPLIDAASYEAKQQALREKEAMLMELENRTIDYIICGEQQPESDHFINTNHQKSKTGYEDGRHWRETTDFVSYKMKFKEGDNTLIININNKDNRTAIVTIDGKEIGRLSNDNEKNKFRITVDKAKTVEISIKAIDGKSSPKIYDLRVVKD